MCEVTRSLSRRHRSTVVIVGTCVAAAVAFACGAADTSGADCITKTGIVGTGEWAVNMVRCELPRSTWVVAIPPNATASSLQSAGISADLANTVAAMAKDERESYNWCAVPANNGGNTVAPQCRHLRLEVTTPQAAKGKLLDVTLKRMDDGRITLASLRGTD
jgi:hypothetical protein